MLVGAQVPRHTIGRDLFVTLAGLLGACAKCSCPHSQATAPNAPSNGAPAEKLSEANERAAGAEELDSAAPSGSEPE